MPIRDCHIIPHSYDKNLIVLPIRIINPLTNQSFKTNGIIDTGATRCAIAGGLAAAIGHNLKEGKEISVGTGSGLGTGYCHLTTIEIFHPLKFEKQIIHTLDNVLIDYMPYMTVVLLGVDGFLSNFILNINYPQKRFSLLNK